MSPQIPSIHHAICYTMSYSLYIQKKRRNTPYIPHPAHLIPVSYSDKKSIRKDICSDLYQWDICFILTAFLWGAGNNSGETGPFPFFCLQIKQWWNQILFLFVCFCPKQFLKYQESRSLQYLAKTSVQMDQRSKYRFMFSVLTEGKWDIQRYWLIISQKKILKILLWWIFCKIRLPKQSILIKDLLASAVTAEDKE